MESKHWSCFVAIVLGVLIFKMHIFVALADQDEDIPHNEYIVCEMVNQKKSLSPELDGIGALVAKALTSLGKPSTPREISEEVAEMSKAPVSNFTDQVQATLEKYEPMGFFKRKGELYSVPTELFNIASGAKEIDAKIENQRVQIKKQTVVLYGALPINPDNSLRHPYLYQFN